MFNAGMVRPGSKVWIPINTFDSNDPSASVTATTWLSSDCHVHKDGGTTQRASSAGETLTIDYDTVAGNHMLEIDTADNTTANFYEAGSTYHVRIEGVTVDAGNVNAWIGWFTIGYPNAIVNTTIATLASQTSFTLEDGAAEADVYNGCPVIVHDLASSVQMAIGVISDYAVTTKTVTLLSDPGIFTMAAGDSISLFMPSNATWFGTVAQAGDGSNLTETGGDGAQLTEAGGTGDHLTAINLPNQTIDIVGSITGNLSGSVGSVSGAVGSVTGAVGSVTGHTNQTGDNFAIVNGAAGLVAIDTVVDSILALFTGITSVAEWLGLLGGKQAGDATALTEIKATGAGSGTYDPTTDALEALRDRGDASWVTGAGGTGLTALAEGTAQAGGTSTQLILAGASTFADNILNGNVVNLLTGTGAGQSRVITANVLSGDICTVYPAWTTNPDATTTYEIVQGNVNVAAISLGGAAADNAELDYDGTGYAKANSTIGTATTNTDMRGTDSAATAAVLGAAVGASISADIAANKTGIDAIPTTAMRGTDSAATAAVLGAAVGASISADIAANKTGIDAIPTTAMRGTDSAALATTVGVAGAGLTDLGGMSTGMKAEVNAEALDVLNTDTFAEPAQGTPGATITLAAKIGYLYKFLRNRVSSNATTISVYNDDATTVDHKSTQSDDATTYERGEFTTGP